MHATRTEACASSDAAIQPPITLTKALQLHSVTELVAATILSQYRGQGPCVATDQLLQHLLGLPARDAPPCHLA